MECDGRVAWGNRTSRSGWWNENGSTERFRKKGGHYQLVPCAEEESTHPQVSSSLFEQVHAAELAGTGTPAVLQQSISLSLLPSRGYASS